MSGGGRTGGEKIGGGSVDGSAIGGSTVGRGVGTGSSGGTTTGSGGGTNGGIGGGGGKALGSTPCPHAGAVRIAKVPIVSSIGRPGRNVMDPLLGTCAQRLLTRNIGWKAARILMRIREVGVETAGFFLAVATWGNERGCSVAEEPVRCWVLRLRRRRDANGSREDRGNGRRYYFFATNARLHIRTEHQQRHVRVVGIRCAV